MCLNNLKKVGLICIICKSDKRKTNNFYTVKSSKSESWGQTSLYRQSHYTKSKSKEVYILAVK